MKEHRNPNIVPTWLSTQWCMPQTNTNNGLCGTNGQEPYKNFIFPQLPITTNPNIPPKYLQKTLKYMVKNENENWGYLVRKRTLLLSVVPFSTQDVHE
jgi:hypothetical protein